MESTQNHSAYRLNPIENNRIWRNDCLPEWDNRQGWQRMGKKTIAEQRKMKERKIPEKWCIVVFRFRLYSSVRVCHFIEILLFMILRLAEQLRRLQLQVKIILCLECGKKQIENQWRKRLTNMIMECVLGLRFGGQSQQQQLRGMETHCIRFFYDRPIWMHICPVFHVTIFTQCGIISLAVSPLYPKKQKTFNRPEQ